MFFCYVDESGDSGTLNYGNPTDTPAFVVLGLILEQTKLYNITHDFIALKRKFFPNLVDAAYPLNDILAEVKGESIRKRIRKGGRRNFSHSIGFLDAIIVLLQEYQVSIIGKGLLKGFGVSNSDVGFYGSAIQHVWRHFQAFLSAQNCPGMVVADSRRKNQNSYVAHSIFTQLFGALHKNYPNMLELPTYAHARNHAMIQITDVVCSGIIYPMLMDAYCSEMDNAHASPKYAPIRARYKGAIKEMQYRYLSMGNWFGGLLVTDATGSGRHTSFLFK
jgi:hypothetical protein